MAKVKHGCFGNGQITVCHHKQKIGQPGGTKSAAHTQQKLEPVASCVIAALFLGQKMGIKILYAGLLILLSVFFCSLNGEKAPKLSRG